MNALKICTHCERSVDAGVNFCPYCGKGEFKDFPTPHAPPSAPVSTQIATPNGYIQLPYYEQLPPVSQKKSKTWVLILILVVSVIIGLVIGLSVSLGSLFSGGDEGFGEYTPGIVENNVYRNEWANIAVELPEGYVNATEEEYLDMEGDSSECGMYYYTTDTGMLCMLLIEEVDFWYASDEAEYLDTLCLQLEWEEDDTFAITTPDDYQEIEIAGETYLVAHCEITNQYGSFVESFYTRMVDDYMLVFMVTNDTAAANNALITGSATAIRGDSVE
ncbi:MAG: zinc ribbon domain-containing protein [Clostridia bacterium]|nr:zinc ribbon domain-containing protein [Clostridia bacterium]